MPVTFERDDEHVHAIFRCDGCGEYASFGEDVHLREAIIKRDPKLGGKWRCGRRSDGTGYCRRAEAGTAAQNLFPRVA